MDFKGVTTWHAMIVIADGDSVAALVTCEYSFFHKSQVTSHLI